MLCPHFCGSTGSEELKGFLNTMITEVTQARVDSSLSKTTSA